LGIQAVVSIGITVQRYMLLQKNPEKDSKALIKPAKREV
jgi:hypothetical protein